MRTISGHQGSGGAAWIGRVRCAVPSRLGWGVLGNAGRTESVVLAVLELLSDNAPTHEFDALITRSAGTGEVDSAVLERARLLSLGIVGQLNRYRQREADFSALVDTAREFTGIGDLDALLKMITRRARLLLGVDMAYISFPYQGENERSVYVRAASGHTSVLSVGLRLPGDAGLGNEVLVNSAPFWTPDYLSDNRIQHSKVIDDVVEAEGLHAIMGVPLSYAAKPFGTLYAAGRDVRHFTADEVALMSSLGDLAGVAIERALLQERSDEAIRVLRETAAAAEASAEALRALDDARRGLVELVNGGTDLPTIVAEAHRHLDGPVSLHAPDGSVLAAVGDPAAQPSVTALAAAQATREPVRVDADLWGLAMVAGGNHVGTVFVGRADASGPLGPEEAALLRAVVDAATTQVQLDNHYVVADDQVRDELLVDLLSSPPRPPRQMLLRARRMGVDLTKPHVVVVVHPESDAQSKVAMWASSFSNRTSGLKAVHRGRVVLLVPGTDSSAVARTVHESAKASLQDTVTVSASSPVTDAASVLHGYAEALRCLEAMAALGSTGKAAGAGELGFVGVLLADNHDVEGFVHSAIGPVIDYDQLRSTDLTRTLEVYFAAGSSPTYAAKQLHVHPNTVARRLERITELLGPRWQEPAQALEVQLALRLCRVRGLLSRAVDRAPEPPDPPEQFG